MKNLFLLFILFFSACKGVITEEVVKDKTVLGALCPIACAGCAALNIKVDNAVKREKRLSGKDDVNNKLKCSAWSGSSHCGADCCAICGIAACEATSNCLDLGIRSFVNPSIEVLKSLAGAISSCTLTYNKNVTTKEEK